MPPIEKGRPRAACRATKTGMPLSSPTPSAEPCPGLGRFAIFCIFGGLVKPFTGNAFNDVSQQTIVKPLTAKAYQRDTKKAPPPGQPSSGGLPARGRFFVYWKPYGSQKPKKAKKRLGFQPNLLNFLVELRGIEPLTS